MSLILWILVGYILLRICLPDIVSEDQFSVQVSSGVSASLAVRYVPVLTSCVDLGQRRQVYCVADRTPAFHTIGILDLGSCRCLLLPREILARCPHRILSFHHIMI